ncbi:MAG: hypothetical protein WDM87_06765 [Terracidiphilus sp.]
MFAKNQAVDKESLDNASRPWENWPYPLVSWWDMEKFSAGPLYAVAKMFGQMQIIFAQYQKDAEKVKGVTFLPTAMKRILGKNLRQIRMYCVKLDLKVAVACIDEALLDLKSELFLPERLDRIYTDLDNSIRRDMQAALFFHVPFNLREFYKPAALFGQDVADHFPRANYDIEEAGTCYAFGRSTACAFHLMRVMEIGVQEFGRILGVTFPEDKEWGKILNIATGKIKEQTELRTRHGRDPEIIAWSQIHAHLNSVGVGCRNPYMHPKETVTMEEAKDIIGLVGGFMRSLAKHIKPTIAGSPLIQ